MSQAASNATSLRQRRLIRFNLALVVVGCASRIPYLVYAVQSENYFQIGVESAKIMLGLLFTIPVCVAERFKRPAAIGLNAFIQGGLAAQNGVDTVMLSLAASDSSVALRIGSILCNALGTLMAALAALLIMPALMQALMSQQRQRGMHDAHPTGEQTHLLQSQGAQQEVATDGEQLSGGASEQARAAQQSRSPSTSFSGMRVASLTVGLLASATRIPYITVTALSGDMNHLAYEAGKFALGLIVSIAAVCIRAPAADIVNIAIQGALFENTLVEVVSQGLQGLSATWLPLTMSFACHLSGVVLNILASAFSSKAAYQDYVKAPEFSLTA